jgi:hypothetical protein
MQINPHKELQFIADNVEAFAKADQELTASESWKSAIKAVEMDHSSQTSIAGKEMEAYGSEAYREWCNAHAKAKRVYIELKLKIELAKLSIEVWRSQEASNRTTDRSLR